MPTSSARPDDLDAYASATGDQQPRVLTAAANLKAALDAFRSSAGRSDLILDVPEVDLDLRFLAIRWDRVGDWLSQVANAFRIAGSGGARLVVVEDHSAAGHLLWSHGPQPARDKVLPEYELIVEGDRQIIDTGAGNDQVSFWPDPDRPALVLEVNDGPWERLSLVDGDLPHNITIRGNAGHDSIHALGNSPAYSLLTLDGGAGDDAITAGDHTDDHAQLIRGDRGDDRLDGRGGNDVLLGGSGNDQISGGQGGQLIDAGDGDDRVYGGEGDDTIYAGNGDDRVTAGRGLDIIYGGEGHDDIDGGTGADIIDAGAGDDTVHGGGNLDGSSFEAGADDRDTIRGGEGRDYIDGSSGSDVIDAGAGDDVVYGGDGVDHIDGGEGRDYIDGGEGDDWLSGGAGDDIVSGGEGDDVLSGDDGNDVIYAGPGTDAVLGGQGTDHLYVENGDIAYGGDPGDQVTHVTIDLSLLENIDIDSGLLVDPSFIENVEIAGPPEFVQRVRADLVTLASSPAGRQMLEALRDSGGPLRVEFPLLTPGGTSYYHEGGIGYDLEMTSIAREPVPPIVGLFHEMAHAYNDRTGTFAWGVYLGPDQSQMRAEVVLDDNGDGRGDRIVVMDTNHDGAVTPDEIDRDDDGDIDDTDLDLNGDGAVDRLDGWTPNDERQAVGLPIDHDRDPNTPDLPASTLFDHPDELTENALRRELAWPERTRY